MGWIDIAMIVFACTAANHLGLVYAAEKVIGFKLPVVNCCKCSSFWLTLLFCMLNCGEIAIITIIAVSFLASICAVWLELLMGFIDTLYDKAYERIYDTSSVGKADGNKNTAAASSDNSKDTMPKM